MLNFRLPSAAIALLLAAPILSGQRGIPNQDPQPIDAPSYMLDAIELNSGSLHTLDLPVDGVPAFEIEVTLGETKHRLRLHNHDMRSSGYKLMVHDADGIHEVESGPVSTYRGTIVGDPESIVAASLHNDQLEAVIIFGDDTAWGIHPAHRINHDLPRSTHLVYQADELIPRDVECGVTAVSQPVPELTPEAVTPRKIVQIALDADQTYWRSNGFNIANTEADMMNVMNVVDAIYQRDAGILYSITTMFVRTIKVYQQDSPGNLLNEFRDRWNRLHATLTRDVTHLFFNKNVRSGVIGVAFLSSICNRFRGYGVSATRFSSNLTRRAALTAHELGHNWSSGHCSSSSSDCRIMCSGIGGCSGDTTRFGLASRTAIMNHKDTRSCLSDPAPLPPAEPTLNSINPTSISAFQPVEITLSGLDLGNVTSIDVGGVVITDFVTEGDNTIRFTPTQSLPITFINPIRVTNPIGTSNTLFLTVFGNHPSVLVADSTVSVSEQIVIEAHTDRQWLVLLFASPSDVPSIFPDVISLAIGDNFTRLRNVRSATSGDDGSHIFSLSIPPTLALPSVLHWQLVTLSAAVGSLPLEVSNTATITIF